MKDILAGIMLILATGVSMAQNDVAPIRPVLSAYTIEAGSSHVVDTYLSPLHYSGWHMALGYDRMQAMKYDPEHWVQQLIGRLSFGATKNPVRSATRWQAMIDVNWGMQRRFSLSQGLKVFVGGSSGIEAGAYYNSSNSNNPVAAKAAWIINAIGGLIYNTSFKQVPICLQYRIEYPLTGIFFSQQYDELYYEIFLGNHSGLVHWAWPGNFSRLNNYLAADFRFSGLTVRLGYRLRVFSSKVNNIVTRDISHMAIVGFTTEWLSLGTKKRDLSKAKIIRALY